MILVRTLLRIFIYILLLIFSNLLALLRLYKISNRGITYIKIYIYLLLN